MKDSETNVLNLPIESPIEECDNAFHLFPFEA